TNGDCKIRTTQSSHGGIQPPRDPKWSQCPIVKGKRTKRHRPLIDSIDQHLATAAAKSEDNAAGLTANTNKEDMANCLILLAQRQSLDSSSSPNNKETPQITNNHKDVKFTSQKLLETPNGSKFGHNVYECKTCFKTFPSFQALGGHLASHMRSKKDIETIRFSLLNESPLESNGQGKKQRLHKCSTCGAEFSSGQALGGHMRRHRGTIGGAISGGLYSHYDLRKSTTSPTLSFTRLTGNASVAMDDESLTTTMEGSKMSLDLDLNLPGGVRC
ncbi:hypothetical protein V2J09_008364, partial [Rumex salicifolius]